ncbi:MAG TPA: M17 family peptidase N-terminal domain-containing protein, partial [Myxococcaceae bacterium]|nr:M17 family peptidase N-terminal domain-containing protein [Myxococcaceae bacterium]
MNFSFIAASAAQKSAADLLVLPLFENDFAPRAAPPALKEADSALGGHLLEAAQQEGFSGKAEQSLVFHTHRKIAAARVLLLGLGQRARFTPEVMRLAAGRAARTAQRLKAKSAAFVLGELRDLEQCIKAVAEGFVLGAYRFDRYRTRKDDGAGEAGPKQVALALPDGTEKQHAHEEMVELGKRVAE